MLLEKVWERGTIGEVVATVEAMGVMQVKWRTLGGMGVLAEAGVRQQVSLLTCLTPCRFDCTTNTNTNINTNIIDDNTHSTNEDQHTSNTDTDTDTEMVEEVVDVDVGMDVKMESLLVGLGVLGVRWSMLPAAARDLFCVSLLLPKRWTPPLLASVFYTLGKNHTTLYYTILHYTTPMYTLVLRLLCIKTSSSSCPHLLSFCQSYLISLTCVYIYVCMCVHVGRTNGCVVG